MWTPPYLRGKDNISLGKMHQQDKRLLLDSRKLVECRPKELDFWDAGHESISAAVLLC
jgi:hypothetical protein